jgi:UDP-N-acetylmuramoyl-tripeptide--D-alanyl-D-alanine ligase
MTVKSFVVCFNFRVNMHMTLREMIQATNGRLISGFPESRYSRLSIDTRTLRAGDVFFAIRGPRYDGHAFMKTAIQKKAKGLVIDRLDPQLPLDSKSGVDVLCVDNTLTALQNLARAIRQKAQKTTFIGLTGSNGKTTTKEMLTRILSRAGKTLSTRGNLNNHIGLPLMLSELEPEHAYALLELGTSKPGDMDLLHDLLQPTVALITNVGKDHLEFFGTPEGVLKENQKLIDRLPKNGLAIINLEDPFLAPFAKSFSGKKVTYGFSSGADVQAADIRVQAGSTIFTLILGKEKCPVTLKTPGRIQVLNALAAAACAYGLKVRVSDIVAGLEAFEPSAMRMETRVHPQGALIVEDAYNANPSSMRASIENFCESYTGRPKWLVLGDMRELGPLALSEHRELGQWLGSLKLDRVYLYGRDTRFTFEGLKSQNFKGVVERYKKKRYLIDVLKRALFEHEKPAILFKASRRMKLEEVSRAL